MDKFRSFLALKRKKLILNHFSDDTNGLKKISFNILTIFLFFSIFLSMGFTRVYPLNIVLKFALLITNILIIFYILLFENLKIDKFLFLIVLSLLWFSFIALLNQNMINQQSFLFNVLNMIPIYLISSSSIKIRNTFFKGIFIGLLTFTFVFTIYYFPDLVRFNFTTRLGRLFGNQNDVAATLLIASTIFLYFGFKGKYLFFFPAFLSVINLISTGSRAGTLNLIVISLILFIAIFRHKNKGVFIGGIVVFVISIVLIATLPAFSSLRERMINMFDVLLGGNIEADGSTFNRLRVIFESFTLFLLSPFFGHQISLVYFSNNAMVAHNAFLEIASRQGIVSLILFVALFIYPLVKLIKNECNHRILYISIIIGCLFFHLTLSALPFKEQYLILVLVMSLLPQKQYIISPRIEYLKLKMKGKVLFLTANQNEKLLVIDYNVLNSKKNIIALPSDKYLPLLQFAGRLNLNSKIKRLKLDEKYYFDKLQFKALHDNLFVVSDVDINNIEHLLLLTYLNKYSNYKTIIISQQTAFDVELLTPSFYKRIAREFVSFCRSLAKPLPQKTSSKEIETSKIKTKSLVARLNIVDKLFLTVFSLLSIISFHYGAKDIVFWQKMLLVLFSSTYYFQVINNIRLDRELTSTKDLLLSFLFISVLPISIFVTLSLLLPNIFIITGVSLYFIIFVFITNTVALLIRYFLNKKKKTSE